MVYSPVWQSDRALKILRCECILLVIKSMGADNISVYYAGDKASPFYTFVNCLLT